MLKVLIVEDDPLFATDMEMCVDALGYEHVATFDRAEEALTFLQEQATDAMICDIQLKGEKTGLDVARWAGKHRVPVVFVTSFADEETFQKARALAPSAYLTKPFKAVDLQRALELAADSLNLHTAGQDEDVPALRERPLFIKHKNRLIKLSRTDIRYVESDGNYATIVTDKTRLVLKRSLRQIEEMLPQDEFVRVHRSYLVRFDAITDVFPENQELGIGNDRIPIGRAFRNTLMERLHIL